MDMLDIIYRALIDFRKNTKDNRENIVVRNAIKSADVDNDLIELTRYELEIELDWIEAIEAGLDPIAKAIGEERQFIRSNGEVVPIEKAKRVSKDSVSHLARHSNLVTKIYDEENIIPDEIYTVEKLSDYAVYENRFLYMLLCYLNDFIRIRFDKIVEISNTYHGALKFKKTVSVRSEKMVVETTLVDERKDDEHLKKNNTNKSIIDRIDILYKSVLMYLNTPLMQEVAKAPMLRPPITKTNVLKMNKNFKPCVALYDFVSHYDKKGYSVHINTKSTNPFPSDAADEIAEAINLLSFLTYEYSNGLQKQLKANYEAEEERRKIEAGKKQQEQIKALKKRVAESGLGVEEYMLLLEKRNRQLEKDSEQLQIAKKEIEELTTKVLNLTEEVARLNEVIVAKDEIIAQKEKEIEELKIFYENQIKMLIEKYEDDLVNLNAYFIEEIRVLIEKYEKHIEELKEQHAREIQELKEQHAEEIQELTDKYEAMIADLRTQFENQINELTEKYEDQIIELTNQYESYIEKLKEAHQEEVQNITSSYEEKISNLQDAYNSQIQAITSNYETTISNMRNEYEGRITSMDSQHRAELEQITYSYQNQIANINMMNEKNVADIRQNYESAINGINANHSKQVYDLNQAIQTLNDEKTQIATQCDEKLNSMSEELNAATLSATKNDAIAKHFLDEKRMLMAELNALRNKYNLLPVNDDFTSKERFNELNEEYRAFKKLFKKEWQKTKRKIYDELKEQYPVEKK